MPSFSKEQFLDHLKGRVESLRYTLSFESRGSQKWHLVSNELKRAEAELRRASRRGRRRKVAA